MDYHRDHSAQWVLRLAQGTDESRQRMIHAFKVIWPYVDELFRDDELTGRLSEAGAAPQPSSLRADFDRLTGEVLAEAELEVPNVQPAPGGGRRGPALRAPRLHPRRDAGARPRVPRGQLVATMEMYVSPTRKPPSAATPPSGNTARAEGLGGGCHRLRPRNPGPHHRGSRHPARCPALRRRRHGSGRPGHHHPDLLRLPRHGRHPGRPHRGLPPRRATRASAWNWSSRRPGPPTG